MRQERVDRDHDQRIVRFMKLFDDTDTVDHDVGAYLLEERRQVFEIEAGTNGATRLRRQHGGGSVRSQLADDAVPGARGNQSQHGASEHAGGAQNEDHRGALHYCDARRSASAALNRAIISTITVSHVFRLPPDRLPRFTCSRSRLRPGTRTRSKGMPCKSSRCGPMSEIYDSAAQKTPSEFALEAFSAYVVDT